MDIFFRINIIKLNKHSDFPLTSKSNEDGVRDFINDMENAIILYIYIYIYICIDKAGLEDWITFHEAEFEIIDGYYYNSGRNNKLDNSIKKLYDVRLKLRNGMTKKSCTSCY